MIIDDPDRRNLKQEMILRTSPPNKPN